MRAWMKFLQGVFIFFAVMQLAHAGVPKHLEVAARAVHQGDTAAALRHLLPLAKRGDAEAQFMLVSVLQASDQKQAGHWLRTAADNRHPAAAHILGLMYLHGNGVQEDPRLAIKWLRIAAEGGIRSAQLQLGQLYRNGPNSIQDDQEAAKWITKAAMAGDAEAQFQLAEMYRYGYGVQVDGNAVQKWLRRAAEQGHPQAASALAK